MAKFHQNQQGVWLRCVAKSKCDYGDVDKHVDSYAAIAKLGGGKLKREQKFIDIRPVDFGYLTVSEEGRIGVFLHDGTPINQARRRQLKLTKPVLLEMLATQEHPRSKRHSEVTQPTETESERDLRLQDEVVRRAKKRAKATKKWRQLTEELRTKSQEYADDFNEPYAYGDDDELDTLHDKRLALIADNADYSHGFEPLPEPATEAAQEAHYQAHTQMLWSAVESAINSERDKLTRHAGNLPKRQLTTLQRRKRGYSDSKGLPSFEVRAREQRKKLQKEQQAIEAAKDTKLGDKPRDTRSKRQQEESTAPLVELSPEVEAALDEAIAETYALDDPFSPHYFPLEGFLSDDEL